MAARLSVAQEVRVRVPTLRPIYVTPLDGLGTKYTLISHPRRRHVQIQVIPGLVIVRTPRRFASHRVPEILRKQARWIRLKLALLEGVGVATRRKYVAGELFPYLGEMYVLDISRTDANTNSSVELNEYLMRLVITVPATSKVNSSTVRETLLRWYRSRANEYLQERVGKLSEITGLSPARVSVKDQKSRWGSCSSSGLISLNWRLMLTPTPIVDYVIAHELCHLKTPNHSPQFWSLLANVDRHYVRNRRWLRDNSIGLGLWLNDAIAI